LLIFLGIFIVVLIVFLFFHKKPDKKATTPVESSSEATTSADVPLTEEQSLPQESITETQTSAQKTYTTTSNLNVRSEPSKNAAILGTLTSGSKVDYLKMSNDEWMVINFGGKEGYVSSQFVKVSD
jgi:uncharacterized protein YgiM (DUF1202 family)